MVSINEWLDSFLALFFPRCCLVCERLLARGEAGLCVRCDMELPRTNYHLQKDNPVERLFWGKIPLERATSYFFYQKGGRFRSILFQLKYQGQKEVGEMMGRRIAAELLSTDFFRDMDVIIPVPLHKKKRRLRGYNQSEWIAKGVSLITGLPIDATAVERKKNTETQTQKTVFERWENVDSTFLLRFSELFVNKHILIIDDVLTTGATTTACASAFNEVKGVRISILTLAVAE